MALKGAQLEVAFFHLNMMSEQLTACHPSAFYSNTQDREPVCADLRWRRYLIPLQHPLHSASVSLSAFFPPMSRTWSQRASEGRT